VTNFKHEKATNVGRCKHRGGMVGGGGSNSRRRPCKANTRAVFSISYLAIAMSSCHPLPQCPLGVTALDFHLGGM
jgi:hypothetical protein